MESRDDLHPTTLPAAADPEDSLPPGMSLLDHLDELRTRLIRALAGILAAYAVSLTFSRQLWQIVSAPAVDALRQLGYHGAGGGPPELVYRTPAEVIQIVWVKLPFLSAVFLASPWILYQVWAFVAPALYRRERRWAVPFVLSAASLFLLGGAFGYFLAFRQGLRFLLSLGRDNHLAPVISAGEYLDLFVNTMLGAGLAFEIPVLVFFLTALGLASPRFLLAKSRYAVLVIVILAAVVTPTPDILNLLLLAAPMCALFYVGVFGGYLLVLRREGRELPWRRVGLWTGAAGAAAAAGYFLARRLAPQNRQAR